MKNMSRKLVLLILISIVNTSVHPAANAAHFQFDCLDVNFTARFVIPVERGENVNTEYYAYDLPLNDSKVVFGSCGYHMDAIVVNWVDKNKSGGMKLSFSFDRSKKVYKLSEIAFYLSAAMLFHNDNRTLNLFYRGDILKSPMGRSYCPKANYSLPLTNEYGNRSMGMGTLELFSLCFEAHSLCEDQLFCDYNAKTIIIVSSIIGSVVLAPVLIGLLCICRCLRRCCKGYTPI
ncbi:uncharacterized protein LOC129565840 isoform X2 [Sitodiplosis mosellana]|nr:uncharacterized protein LOC129565840 isoform X2 [Sitodiplosis mosellana]